MLAEAWVSWSDVLSVRYNIMDISPIAKKHQSRHYYYFFFNLSLKVIPSDVSQEAIC